MQSSNPILGRRGSFGRGGYATFDATPSDQQLQNMYDAPSYAPPKRMTIDDVVMRTAFTLGTLVAGGAVAWVLDVGMGVAIVAALIGFGLALVNIFKRNISPPLVLAYAAAQGVAMGAISHLFNAAYPGIVIQAVLGTVLAFAGMLAAYSSGKIRVTPKFTKIVVGAMVALVGLMLINIVVSLFGVAGGIGIRSGGPLAIVFSLAAIVIGCLILALDFASIEEGVKAGAPEREAWRGAFGLTLTLVWIYLEILRLLSYFRE